MKYLILSLWPWVLRSSSPVSLQAQWFRREAVLDLVLCCVLLCCVSWLQLWPLSGADAIEWISKAFKDESALLKHELAYCLGQMQDKQAIPTLSAVLKDTEQEPMVRHEAGKLEQTSIETLYSHPSTVILMYMCEKNRLVPAFTSYVSTLYLWLHFCEASNILWRNTK